jgi:elongator complex protein 2
VRLWLWRHGPRSADDASGSGQCLAVLIPDGRALVDRQAQGEHDRDARDSRLRAASGAAATSSAAAAAAPSQRAPPASVGAASCVAAQALDSKGERVLLAVSSAAPHVALWECDVGALVRGAVAAEDATPPPVRLVQRLRIDGCLQHALAITPLPSAVEENDDDNNDSKKSPALLLASGGTDGAVRLFVRPAAAAGAGGDGTAASQFEPAATLTGHDNWVRGLAFAHTYAAGEEEEDDDGKSGQQQQQHRRKRRRALLLASASQDTRVRVWRLEQETPKSSFSATTAPAAAAAAAEDATADADALLDAALLRYAPRAAVRVPPAPTQSAPSSSFEWTASLEALLSGHEDWVHAVQWRPPPPPAAAAGQKRRPPQPQPLHLAPPPPPRSSLVLLSASHDRTVALWRREPRSGVWLSEAALGDAGATCFGYFGARWGPRGRSLVAHGHTGAMHLWRDFSDDKQSPDASLLRSDWRPVAAGGGHTGAVVDLAWVAVDPPAASAGCERRRRPRLLLHTASADQTARLFAEVATTTTTSAGGARRRWCELARTQVHGHDFSALAPIPSPFAFSAESADCSSPPALMYACCSEEKVLRVFEAPQAFLDTLELTWPEEDEEGAGDGDGAAANDDETATAATTPQPMTPEQQLRARGGRRGRPLGAAAQALGLSNKAIFAEDLQKEGEEEEDEAVARGNGGGGGGGKKKNNSNNTNDPLASAEGPDQAPFAAPAAVSGPPLEEHLAQSTLWPEAAKLHGHANDAFCCAASPCGRLLASACRAQASSPRDADVWVWEVGSWRCLARLSGGHTLTATQLAFSPFDCDGGGRWLASVSRDRSLAVWRALCKGGGDEWNFELVARVPAAHARVIWGVAWAAGGGGQGGSARRGPVLATGARDGLVRLWEVVDEESEASQQQVRRIGQLPAFAAAVTAVAAAPRALVEAAAAAAAEGASSDDCAVLAIGLEDGGVQAWLVSCRSVADDHHRLLWSAGPSERHAGAVRRLAWAPVRASGGGGGGAGDRRRPFLLASCGEDGAVRIIEVFTH